MRKKRISRFMNMKVGLGGVALGFWTLTICAGFSELMPEPDLLVVMLIVEALLIWRFVVNLKIYQSPEYKQKQEDARTERAARKAAAAQRAEETRRKRALQEEAYQRDHTPVSAVLITTQDRTKTSKSAVGAAGRAVIGGALLGPVGALAGAASTGGKTKVVGQKATFSVKYASGRVGTETVEVGSTRFNELATLLLEDK